MIQPSHPSTHLQIEHLTYQNQLLQQRNQLLALENQRLLQELTNCHAMMDPEEIERKQKQRKEMQVIMQTVQQQMPQLIQPLGKEMLRKVKPYLRWSNDQHSSCPDFLGFCTSLIAIIKQLAQGCALERDDKAKRRLDEREQRLLARRGARERTQQVLHIIKAPDEQISQCSSRSVTQELAQQREFFQKLVRRVRREGVSPRQIQNIYDQLDDTNRIRTNLRKQSAQLALLQRQFQLGSLDPVSLAQTVDSVKRLSAQLASSKKQLQERVNSL